ncbi:MAG: hypothetical protein ACREGR_00230 [Minisyncoccia bacterium]
MTFWDAYQSKGQQVRVTGYKPALVGTLVSLRKINRSWYGVIKTPDRGEVEFRLKWLVKARG